MALSIRTQLDCAHSAVDILHETIDEKDEQITRLVEALEMARKAIISLPDNALGIGCDGKVSWSLRDELYDKLGAIAKAKGAS